MNAFADSLFSLLFGWLRSMIQSIWGAVSSGNLSSFFTWLGDHWLWVALMIILGATIVDFLIWMIRWRPYLIWKTKIRRLIRFFKYGKSDMKEQQHFQQGYEEAVPLDMPPEEYNPVYEPEPAFAYEYSFAPPAWEEEKENSAQEEAAPAYQAPRVFQPYVPAPVPNAAPESAPAAAQYFAKPQGYEPPPINTSTRVHGGQSSDMPAARRKRRSDKYDKQKASWHQRLMADHDEDYGLLDGLPPAVDKNQAFHEPVYPQQNPYAAWQRPATQNQGTDHQA